MNKIVLFAATACFLLAFGSCKPKQSAYKAAYEQAKEKETTAPVTEEVDETYDEEEVAPVSKPRTTNAYSLKERMQNEGYHAVLGENEQGMLRVIVSSFDDKADAAASRDAIKAKYAPNFQDAWLLERAY